MNLFNCFQAMAFYTIMPFGIQWLFQNQYNGWAYVLCVAQFIGFVMASVAIHNTEVFK